MTYLSMSLEKAGDRPSYFGEFHVGLTRLEDELCTRGTSQANLNDDFYFDFWNGQYVITMGTLTVSEEIAYGWHLRDHIWDLKK